MKLPVKHFLFLMLFVFSFHVVQVSLRADTIYTISTVVENGIFGFSGGATDSDGKATVFGRIRFIFLQSVSFDVIAEDSEGNEVRGKVTKK